MDSFEIEIKKNHNKCTYVQKYNLDIKKYK